MTDSADGRPDLLPDYAEWLARVVATVQAVSYTCRIRLGDGVAAEAVALRVATGLVARPAVFRHWGLPYSGRIAKLAEAGIADALAGRATGDGSWTDFHTELTLVPTEHQETLVATCVEGLDDATLATSWGCGTEAAGRRRAATLAHMRELALRCGDERAVVTTERNG